MYQIAISNFPHPATPIKTVDSFDAARAYLATLGNVVCFELDDEADAADAAVMPNRLALNLYTVERV